MQTCRAHKARGANTASTAGIRCTGGSRRQVEWRARGAACESNHALKPSAQPGPCLDRCHAQQTGERSVSTTQHFSDSNGSTLVPAAEARVPHHGNGQATIQQPAHEHSGKPSGRWRQLHHLFTVANQRAYLTLLSNLQRFHAQIGVGCRSYVWALPNGANNRTLGLFQQPEFFFHAKW